MNSRMFGIIFGIQILKIYIKYSFVLYIQELKMAEIEHRIEKVISKDSEVNRNKFM